MAEESDILALLCSARFPQPALDRLVLMPDALLDGVVNGVHGIRTLGVLVPSSSQIHQMLERWKRPNRKVVVESASPYSRDDEVTSSAQRLAVSSPDLVVLDCIGYTFRTREVVKEITGKPAILPRSVLARSILELIG